jgi:hypothetical protein
VGTSHVFTRFGGFLLRYCHDDSPFSDGRFAATLYLSGYLKVLQGAEFEIDIFIRAVTGTAVQVNTA